MFDRRRTGDHQGNVVLLQGIALGCLVTILSDTGDIVASRVNSTSTNSLKRLLLPASKLCSFYRPYTLKWVVALQSVKKYAHQYLPRKRCKKTMPISVMEILTWSSVSWGDSASRYCVVCRLGTDFFYELSGILAPLPCPGLAEHCLLRC
ncbi:hypothetical protein EDC04DRAFT_1930645 [Pisolithus marmoratus]|nr:hypothetical protein EDC04DRAFT_1930645 [Pisolithus marmoratus]